MSVTVSLEDRTPQQPQLSPVRMTGQGKIYPTFARQIKHMRPMAHQDDGIPGTAVLERFIEGIDKELGVIPPHTAGVVNRG
jgi:hypothetical protein